MAAAAAAAAGARVHARARRGGPAGLRGPLWAGMRACGQGCSCLAGRAGSPPPVNYARQQPGAIAGRQPRAGSEKCDGVSASACSGGVGNAGGALPQLSSALGLQACRAACNLHSTRRPPLSSSMPAPSPGWSAAARRERRAAAEAAAVQPGFRRPPVLARATCTPADSLATLNRAVCSTVSSGHSSLALTWVAPLRARHRPGAPETLARCHELLDRPRSRSSAKWPPAPLPAEPSRPTRLGLVPGAAGWRRSG